MEKVSEDQAIVAILTKHARAYFEKRDLLKSIEDAQARIQALDKIMGDANSGLRVFDIDVDNNDVWKALVEKHLDQIKFELWDVQPQSIAATVPQNIPAPAASEPPTIYQMALQYLKQAGDKGAKASVIQTYVEKALGREIHFKTIGMSLYRLLKRGQVRRKGHTWFYVSQETENPGAVTPGEINPFD